jgi:CTP-dependent riboflavin kinase
MFLMHEKITSGLVLAGYFLSRKDYRRQFPELLGFLPFPSGAADATAL